MSTEYGTYSLELGKQATRQLGIELSEWLGTHWIARNEIQKISNQVCL
jgi:hypothetical protein